MSKDFRGAKDIRLPISLPSQLCLILHHLRDTSSHKEVTWP